MTPELILMMFGSSPFSEKIISEKISDKWSLRRYNYPHDWRGGEEMKPFSPTLLAIFLAAVIVTMATEARSADWRQFAEATTGVFDYDAASVTSSSEGIVRAWIHNVNKHETMMVELNCMGGDYRVLDRVEYDETGNMKSRSDNYGNPDWLKIVPKSVAESLQNVVCR